MKAHRIFAVAALCANLASPALAQTAAPAPTASVITNATPAEIFLSGSAVPNLWSSRDAIGQAVYNKANERLGDVEELLIDHVGKVMAAVVGVGGFLGMGETKVAISYPSIQMMPDRDGKSRLVVDATRDALKKAPAFKASDMMKRS